MRIGMMLRAIDEQGGVGVYTRNLVSELLGIDDRNKYVLYYRDPANIGRFAHHNNVTERLIKGGNKAFWDQVAIPYACWRDKIDLVFHPKFTTPLLAPCKAVMVVHGADWFIPEQAKYYGRIDISYIKLMMPLYFKKASSVLSVSQLTTENFNRVLELDPGKIKTVYFGPGRHFKHIDDRAFQDTVRERYNLPDKFILTLTRHGRGGDRRKNFGHLLEAYAYYHSQTENPYSLVVGGKDCHLFRHEYGIPDADYGLDIAFPDWIAQEDLPAVYSLAALYLYPSNLEAFPIPLTEAMACGTPIVTSNVNGLKEIAGDAAVFVDPENVSDIAEAISRVASDRELQLSLSKQGLERSRSFSWDKCAKETLAALEQAVSK